MSKTLPSARKNQQEILEYSHGRMGVAAVPGSGKTWTLSRLAAQLVEHGGLRRRQQVLVVTLVNSARGKFEQQVRDFLPEGNLGTLYRVRTLHGLANDIVSERPGLVGLSEDFQILDDYASREIVREALNSWFNINRDFGVEEYIREEDRNKEKSRWQWREESVDIALDFIRQAKDYRRNPEALRAALSASASKVPIAEMCVTVYEAYERSLRYRGAADFQDLIRLALDALEADEEFLERLRRRWPYILEDEAQDSSKLQEDILRMLVGENGNWVRVGDPNQAIYETFTTANPKYLRDFIVEEGVTRRELPQSGRSAPSIIQLANSLISWSLAHPIEAIRRKSPLTTPFIEPLESGNPNDLPSTLQLYVERNMSPEEERVFVAESLRTFIADNPDKTVAVLLPTNVTGAEMAKVLRDRQVKHTEMLRATTATRQVAGSLLRVMNFIVQPVDATSLAEAFVVWRRDQREDPETLAVGNLLRRAAPIERYTAPRDRDWLLETIDPNSNRLRFDGLESFRQLTQRWQTAAVLPVDELVLTIANDIFREPAEIATAYSIALHLRSFAELHPEHRLAEYVQELREIALNRRKVTGLSDDDEQFDPTRYKGQAIIMTHHGAKGLEWDRVYLMSVSNYDFPSADPFDRFMGEKWFARNRLNLRAEGLAQLRAITFGEEYVEGVATREARVEYAAERLRLLYVGITRAKSELIITWNTGRQGDMIAAKPLPALAVRARNPTA